VIRRREFITLLGGAAAAWPMVARAQQSMRRIAVIMVTPETDPIGRGRLKAFRQGIEALGWIDGRNTRIEGDCCIFHGVTFGDRGSEWTGVQIPDGHPTVERSCMFGAGAKVLGPVTIGRNSIVGANAVVNKSLPPNSIAVGVPARVVGERPEMDENLRPIHRREAAAGVPEVSIS